MDSIEKEFSTLDKAIESARERNEKDLNKIGLTRKKVLGQLRLCSVLLVAAVALGISLAIRFTVFRETPHNLLVHGIGGAVLLLTAFALCNQSHVPNIASLVIVVLMAAGAGLGDLVVKK